MNKKEPLMEYDSHFLNRVSVFTLLLHLSLLTVMAGMPYPLHAQQSVVADEQVFFLQDGTRIRDINTPALGKEIRVQRAAGLQWQNLTDDIKEDIMDAELGDIDNDGEEELVVLGRTKLAVYEFNGDQYLLAPERTLNLYDRSIYDRNPKIPFEEVYAPYEGQLVWEEDRSGGRLAIGDADNDGKNEIIITRIVAYTNLHFPFSGHKSVTEILKWVEGNYVLQDVFMIGSLRDGVFILDLDGDREKEIVVGRGSNYGIFGWVERPEEYTNYNKSIYGHHGSYTGRYQPEGLLILTENTDEISQVSAIIIQDSLPVIFRAGLAAIAGDTRTLGTVRSYVLDQEHMSVLTSEGMKLSSPEVPYIWGKDLEQKYMPVQVPATGELLQRRAEVSGLSLGDFDGNGVLDIIVNMPSRALVYELAK